MDGYMVFDEGFFFSWTASFSMHRHAQHLSAATVTSSSICFGNVQGFFTISDLATKGGRDSPSVFSPTKVLDSPTICGIVALYMAFFPSPDLFVLPSPVYPPLRELAATLSPPIQWKVTQALLHSLLLLISLSAGIYYLPTIHRCPFISDIFRLRALAFNK